MPYYSYKALENDGTGVTGVLPAESETQLAEQLSRSNRLLVSARGVSGPRQSVRAGVSRKDLIAFTAQLAVIAGSGIGILEGLEDIATQSDTAGMRRMVENLVQNLDQGSSLSEAMASNPAAFGSLYVNTVRSGEETGDLEGVLQRLTTYLEWEQEIASKVKQAAMYPLILTVLLGSVLVVLVGFVLPRFAAIFARKGFDLPLPTRIVLWGAAVLTGYWWLILAAAAGMVVALVMASRTRKGKLTIDRVKMRVPILGGLTRRTAISRFAHTLATTVGAGVDIIRALRLAGAATGNLAFEGTADRVADRISDGSTLADALRAVRLFPPLFVRMAGVGETTGALSRMLDRASDFYDREIRVTVARMMTLSEAGVTVAMGFVVGLVALSVFLPLYQMLAFIKK
jgi:type IV pilus assembly protein PilC